MHTKTLVAAVIALIGAASAFAQEISPVEPIAQHSTLTRAEVRAAAVQAREAGLVSYGEVTQFAAPSGFAKTRAQVRAETLEAVRIGAIAHGEQSFFPTAAQLESIRLAGLKAMPMEMAAR